jgi:hypothetical protein
MEKKHKTGQLHLSPQRFSILEVHLYFGFGTGGAIFQFTTFHLITPTVDKRTRLLSTFGF